MRRYVYKKKGLTRKKKIRKLIGLSLISLGFGAIFYFFFPVVSFYLYLSQSLSSLNIETPLPEKHKISQADEIKGLFSSSVLGVTKDTNDVRNLLPEKKSENSSSKITEYELSIPSQKIYKAKVSATDFNLSNHLVQYFSTSKNPTEKGTTVIFGHSSIPQWFDPTDYTKIFSKVHLLKIGQTFSLHVDGKAYKYKVLSKTILGSKDPRVFYQNFDNSYVSLVTCTPPGTTWKRLVVRGSLQKS